MKDYSDISFEKGVIQSELLTQLFDSTDLTDEQILLEMSVIECNDLRDMILNEKFKQQEDAFPNLLTFILRLAQSEDKMVDCFVDHKTSLFTFVFDMVAAKFQEICTFFMNDHNKL